MATSGTTLKSIGAKLTLEGEKDYRDALTSIVKAQSVLRSEMRLCEAEFKSNADSAEALQKKQEILEKEYTAQTDRVNVLKEALENAKQQYGENSNQAMDWQAKLNNAQTTLKNLDSELEANRAKLRDAESGTASAEDAVSDLNKAMDGLEEELETNTELTGVFGDVLKANLASDLILNGAKALASGIKTIGESVISTGSSFEAAMSNVEALLGLEEDEQDQMDALTEKASEMGAKTKFSATESADAFTYMAMAGWKTADMLDGIEGIMNLAAASGEELATTSDIVTDALTAFGLSASDSGHFADVLAAATSSANTTVSGMGETFKYVGPMAGALGYNIEGVSMAVGLMANAGIKGSQAGTSLNAIITRLSTNTSGATDEIEKLGVAFYNEDGSARDLTEVMGELRIATAGMTEEQKSNFANTVAGMEAQKGLLAILNASEDDYNKLSAAIAEADGSAKNMADTMNNNLKGDITIMGSALEGLGNAIYSKFEDPFRHAVQSATNGIGELHDEVEGGKLGDSLDRLAGSVDDLAVSAINLGIEVLPGIVDGLAFLIDNREVITGVIVGGATAWGAYELAVNGAVIKQTLLNAAIAANPVGLAVTAIGALTVGTIAYANEALNTIEVVEAASDESLEELESRIAVLGSLEEHQGNLSIGYGSMAAGAKKNAEQMHELSMKTYEYGNATYEVTEEVSQQLEEAKEKYTEMYESAFESLSGQMGLFDEFDTKTVMSTKKMMDNLQSQIDGMSTWSDDLQRLAKKGISEGLLKELMEMGPASYQYVHSLVTMSEEEIDDLNNLYRKKLNIQNVIAEEIAESKSGFTAEMDELLQTAEEKSTALSTVLRNNISVSATMRQKADFGAFAVLMEDTVTAQKRAEESMQRLSLKMFEYGDTTHEVTEGAYDQLEMMQEKYDDLYESAYDSISGQIGLFNDFDTQTVKTKDEMLKSLQSQIDGMTSWAEDMQTLAAKGIDEGLLEQLREMGPKSYQYVHGLVTMSDGEIAELNRLYSEKLDIQGTVAKEMMDTNGEFTAQIDLMVKKAEEKAAAMKAAGENVGKGFADGIASKIPDVLDKGIQLAGGLLDTIAKKLQIHSPSQAMDDLGVLSGEGYENGAVRSFEKANTAIAGKIEELKNVKTALPALGDVEMIGGRNSSATATGTTQIIGLLQQILKKNQNIYLNSGALVGGLVDDIDNGLADTQSLRERYAT